MHFDVVIIGSGPAGCAAAIACKQHGLNSLLITGRSGHEEADQPVESIHPGVLTVLDHLKAMHCVTAASQGTYEGVCTGDQFNPLGEDVHGRWKGHHVNRKIFDEVLLKCSIEQGVNVLENESVTGIISTADRVTGIRTNEGSEISCRFLVDASGQKRIAGKKLNFKEVFHSPPLAVWTGTSTDVPPSSFIFERNCSRFIPHGQGWTWLAPQPPGRCTWTRMEVKGKQDLLPPMDLRDLALSTKIKSSNRRWRVFRPVCSEGILLCGDAAGIIDPAAGQGILNAMLSAIRAVRTINSCLHEPHLEAMHLAAYDDWFISDYMDKVGKLKYFYSLHNIKLFNPAKTRIKS